MIRNKTWRTGRSFYTRVVCSILKSLSLYTPRNYRGREAGSVGTYKTIFAGLLGDIMTKVVGIKGSFDHLLARVRFEEAKLQDLNTTSTGSLLKSSGVGVTSNITDPVSSVQNSSRITANGSNNRQQRLSTSRFNVGGQRANARCYNCGSPSHLIRRCPYLVRNRATETPGLHNLRIRAVCQMLHQWRHRVVIMSNLENPRKRQVTYILMLTLVKI